MIVLFHRNHISSLLMTLSVLFIKETSGRFDYDPNSRFGPSNWERAGEGDPFLSQLSTRNKNKCEFGKRQSPIDLKPNSKCVDDHQIHHRRGRQDWDTLTFEILPHVLRVHFPEFTEEDKMKPENETKWPPKSNLSNLSEWEAVLFMDVKIPSEHKIYGKQYAGEVQIGHKFGNRVIIISIMLDYEDNTHSNQFQQFIYEWEEVNAKNVVDCYNQLVTEEEKVFYNRTHPILDEDKMAAIWGFESRTRSNFDLFDMLPTVYYFGYDGSYTSPPCTERVHWRVMDLPMQISHEQFTALQSLFLDQVNKDCETDNKVAFQGGVNRPIQKNINDIWHCNTNFWKPLDRTKWCDKWPKDYHGYHKLTRMGECEE